MKIYQFAEKMSHTTSKVTVKIESYNMSTDVKLLKEYVDFFYFVCNLFNHNINYGWEISKCR